MYIIKKINNDFRRDGTFYYKDPECIILHREDGPAIEYANGTKCYIKNGLRHREDGPAVEWNDGYKEWWLNNKHYGSNNDFTNKSWKKFVKTLIFS